MRWIRNLLSKLFARPKDEEEYSLSLWKPAERQIYRYFNGKQVVHKDPLVLLRRVNDHAHNIDTDVKAISLGWKDKATPYASIVKAICEIFDVQPLNDDGVGLTEPEMFALFDHYLMFEDVKKKLASSLPTTVGGISTLLPSLWAEGSPTKNTTPSSSTSDEPSTSGPTLSPSESVLGSVLSTPASNTAAPSPTANSKPG